MFLIRPHKVLCEPQTFTAHARQMLIIHTANGELSYLMTYSGRRVGFPMEVAQNACVYLNLMHWWVCLRHITAVIFPRLVDDLLVCTELSASAPSLEDSLLSLNVHSG